MHHEQPAQGQSLVADWRAPTGEPGRLLGRVDLGAALDARAGGEQVVLRVLDVVDEPTLLAVEPDVADCASDDQNVQAPVSVK